MLVPPPNVGNIDGIDEIKSEIAKHRANAVGTILIGDMNVHSIHWLRHSTRESMEAKRLRGVCEELGMKQRVSQPTRKDNSGSDYLLDLLLTDVDVETTVGGKIMDHRYVLTKMRAFVPDTIEVQREVWN